MRSQLSQAGNAGVVRANLASDERPSLLGILAGNTMLIMHTAVHESRGVFVSCRRAQISRLRNSLRDDR